MSFFISNAMAAATGAAPAQSEGTFSLFLIVAIFVLFYFMLIRPQSKRAKEHRDLVNKLQKGDEIVTAGGLVGKVANVDEQFMKIMISEGVEITMQRNAVTTVLPKGTLKSL